LKTNRKWLYLSDELEIDHTADDERLKEVLNELGRDEMFDKLWDEATAKVEQPSPPQKEIRLTDLQREMDEFKRSLDNVEGARAGPFFAICFYVRDQSQTRLRTVTSSPKRLVRWSIMVRQSPYA
jgi:hypothetical protein